MWALVCGGWEIVRWKLLDGVNNKCMSQGLNPVNKSSEPLDLGGLPSHRLHVTIRHPCACWPFIMGPHYSHPWESLAHPHLLVRPISERFLSINIGYIQWFSLAKLDLKVVPADKSRSSVTHTNKYGWVSCCIAYGCLFSAWWCNRDIILLKGHGTFQFHVPSMNMRYLESSLISRKWRTWKWTKKYPLLILNCFQC